MNRINLDNIRRNKEFIERFGLEQKDEFILLGQGEYNINYILIQNLIMKTSTENSHR